MTERAAPSGEAGQVSTPANGVVVGHDGSLGAHHALRTALEFADQLGEPLLIVRAWSIDTAPRPDSWEFGYVSPWDELAQAVDDQLVKDTRSQVEAFPKVPVDYRAVMGGPAACLIEASRSARMLVLGSRGRGGFAGLMLGSVSYQCVSHAACPVLVARLRPEPRTTSGRKRPR